MKLKKGDEVKILQGKDRGKIGKVEKVFSKIGKVLVLGINQYKRHVKGRSRNQKSEIVTITKPVPVSSVIIICPKCHSPTRVGFRFENSTKARFCKKCEQAI